MVNLTLATGSIASVAFGVLVYSAAQEPPAAPKSQTTPPARSTTLRVAPTGTAVCTFCKRPCPTCSPQNTTATWKSTSTTRPTLEYYPRPTEAAEKIREKLTRPVSLEFRDTQFQEVIEFIQQYTNVNIVLNRPAMEEVGITAESPVSIHLAEIKLEAALRLLLQQLNMTFLIRDDVLMITTQTAANESAVIRVYPVGDLCQDSAQADQLVRTILSTVQPNSWSQNGGTGSVEPVSNSSSLVIQQCDAGHDQVLELLRSLRESKPAPDR